MTRSGKVFGRVDSAAQIPHVLPPSSFDISALLKKALEFDPDPTLYENLNYMQGQYYAPDADLSSDMASLPSEPDHAPILAPSKNRRAHERRRQKRQAKASSNEPARDPRPVVAAIPLALHIPLDFNVLPSSSCGYIAARKKIKTREVHSLDYYTQELGFPVLKWDGRCVSASSCQIGVLTHPSLQRKLSYRRPRDREVLHDACCKA